MISFLPADRPSAATVLDQSIEPLMPQKHNQISSTFINCHAGYERVAWKVYPRSEPCDPTLTEPPLNSTVASTHSPAAHSNPTDHSTPSQNQKNRALGMADGRTMRHSHCCTLQCHLGTKNSATSSSGKLSSGTSLTKPSVLRRSLQRTKKTRLQKSTKNPSSKLTKRKKTKAVVDQQDQPNSHHYQLHTNGSLV